MENSEDKPKDNKPEENKETKSTENKETKSTENRPSEYKETKSTEYKETKKTDLPVERSRSNRGLSILLLIIILILGVVIIYFVKELNQKKREAAETEQVLEDQKTSLSNELKGLIVQYDSLKSNNDSINRQIGVQQDKIKKLLSIQGSNAVLIEKYKKELGTLREVLKSYIAQVDSLNTRNQQLITENVEVKTNLEQARNENIRVNKEKSELSSQVQKASVITTSNLLVTPLNKRGKVETKVSRILKLKVCFTMRENTIATAGTKDVFIRITRPDGAVIAYSETDLFTFQNQQIVFSAKRQVEYANKDLDVCIYWDNNNQLVIGDYTIDIFTDGNLIGTTKFTLKKK